jgi:hypothetical protein
MGVQAKARKVAFFRPTIKFVNYAYTINYHKPNNARYSH